MLKPFDGWQNVAPEWIHALPRDRRGFPIPAEVPWQNGAPLLQGADPARAFVLGLHRRCAVCGHVMSPNGQRFRTFAQPDAARIRGFERKFSNDFGGPAHESCMLFSSIACPHLRDGSSTLGRANKINAGASRGTLAAVLGFESYSLLVPIDKPVFEDLLFGYYSLVADVRYRNGDELREQLAYAIDRDRDSISGTRMFWTGSEADYATLVRDATAGIKKTEKLGVVREIPIVGRGRFGEVQLLQ